MLILSIVFTSVIILAYSSALYQLIKQRQISQIKTDFINNMTHEFKTPIATINLALDSIKNPKILEDKRTLPGSTLVEIQGNNPFSGPEHMANINYIISSLEIRIN